MHRHHVAPPTRLGLVLSISGFAIAVTMMASDAAQAALRTPYSLSWVLLLIIMVYPPRMIRPGAGWARECCRRPQATILYAAGAGITIGGATWALSAGGNVAIVTGVVVLAIAALAAALPAAAHQEHQTSAQ